MSEIAARDADIDLAPFAQLGNSAEGIGDIQWIVKVGHQDCGAQADWHLGCNRGQNHQLATVPYIVVYPDLFETALCSQLGQTHQSGNRVVIGEVSDELKSQLAVEYRHGVRLIFL